ncbi:uncharacterized protein ARMOST_20143 [Armillaria ostoyae]|uniref:Uncharacterized protein n=1 Tax=Armillaria ostoyae TaxID=47428 RepID=A0A284S6H5_ARMOS|nr:uncharacterized protein ARMOST_20143 [Armillaria ostoyae]
MPSTLTQQHVPEPTVDGSGEQGWKSLPDIVDATLYPTWVVNNDKGAYLPVYQTANLDVTKVTRAQRACWSDWNAANNALSKATYNDPAIKRSEISIMCPVFLTEADLCAGAAQDGQLLWGKTNWISGSRNVGPDSVTGVSSFDVLDALVAYYMDRKLYPKLKVLVVGGHSAGGQMAQRYAILRTSTDDDDRLHFWIANPGSLCWLTSNRPIPNDGCEGVDAFKYGLNSNFPAYATKNARALGREGIIKRYHSRTLNYAWGLVLIFGEDGDDDHEYPQHSLPFHQQSSVTSTSTKDTGSRDDRVSEDAGHADLDEISLDDLPRYKRQISLHPRLELVALSNFKQDSNCDLLNQLKCVRVFLVSRDLSVEEEGLGCNLWPSTRFLGDPCGTRQVDHDLSRSMDSLRVTTLGGGAYGNEADVYPPDWQRAFPGRITRNCRG